MRTWKLPLSASLPIIAASSFIITAIWSVTWIWLSCITASPSWNGKPLAAAPPPRTRFTPPSDLKEDLKKILGSWNVCSKEWVVRQYDHEVQGTSVLKPLVGAANDGPGDAAVIRPLSDSDKGIIISNGINPKYGDIDTYWMAASAIDEALRQVIAVGGSLDEVALLDNFCWGNPEKPDRLGALVRAAQACYDTAIVYGTPFISGKDSLYNEYETGQESICIPPTLLISAMAVMDDVNKVRLHGLQAGGRPDLYCRRYL